MDLGHWKHFGPIPKVWVGFVYLITSPTGKMYIGRKNRFIKRSKVKESNWRNYSGSSKSLSADIKAMGGESFTFKILHFCKSLSEIAIMETTEILTRNALFSADYYNKYCYLKLINNKK